MSSIFTKYISGTDCVICDRDTGTVTISYGHKEVRVLDIEGKIIDFYFEKDPMLSRMLCYVVLRDSRVSRDSRSTFLLAVLHIDTSGGEYKRTFGEIIPLLWSDFECYDGTSIVVQKEYIYVSCKQRYFGFSTRMPLKRDVVVLVTIDAHHRAIPQLVFSTTDRHQVIARIIGWYQKAGIFILSHGTRHPCFHSMSDHFIAYAFPADSSNIVFRGTKRGAYCKYRDEEGHDVSIQLSHLK